MITFTPSPTFVDAVINHPSVRPTMQLGTHRLSSEDVLHNPANYAVAFANGVAIFIGVSSDVYEGHISVVQGHRGCAALQFGRAAIHKLIEARCPHRLIAAVPIQLPAARVYCRRLGLKPESRDLFQEYFNTECKSWAA